MKQETTQYDRMVNTPVGKLIVTLGIPTIISMLVTNIYNMADTYFVGTINTSASGATGIVFSLMAVFQAFGFMFGHGAGSNISRHLGARDIAQARNYSAASFYLSIIVGLCIMIPGLIFIDPLMRILGSTETILPYARIYAFYILIAGPAFTCSCVLNNILRYEGKAFFAMIGLGLGGILNIFGDAILINVFDMGIGGAGLSTAVSQYISTVVLMIPYLRGQTTSKIGIQYFKPTVTIVKNIISVGMPSLMRQGLNSVASMVLNTCAGNYGDAAVAAISIVSRIMNFLLCIALGLGQGFQPVCAFNYGAKKYSRVKAGFWFAMKVSSVIMIVMGILAYINAGMMITIFRDDAEVIAIGTTALRFQCFALLLMPLSMYGNMLFQCIGESKIATFLASLRSGLILIPLVLLLTAVFGLSGLECAQAISETLSACISLPFIIHLFKNLSADV